VVQPDMSNECTIFHIVRIRGDLAVAKEVDKFLFSMVENLKNFVLFVFELVNNGGWIGLISKVFIDIINESIVIKKLGG
jgi:hypothetical protein